MPLQAGAQLNCKRPPMPQLDKVTFFAQVTWSLTCYFFLYFLFSVHIGPAIGRVLKVRSKINLGGTSAEAHSTSSFVGAISRVPSASLNAPLSFLKAFGLASRIAASSVINSFKELR